VNAAVSTVLLSPADADRVAEVRRLGRLGADGVKPLIDCLVDPSWAVRREVTVALAQLGDLAVPALQHALTGQRDNEARVAALVDALVASSGKPEFGLIELTRWPNAAVVCDAVAVLGRRHAVTALEVLAPLVEHSDDNVAVAAIEALGRLGGQQSVDRLIRVLEGGNFFRIFPAIDVIGRLGDLRATSPLLKLAARPIYTLEATRALGRIGDIRAIPAIVGMLASTNNSLVRTAAASLWEIHKKRFEGTENVAQQPPTRWLPARPESCVHRLIDSWKGADSIEQVAMCHVLGWLGTRDATHFLLGMLKNEGDVAEAAKAALVRLGSAIDAELFSALRSGDSAQRAAVLPLAGRARARPELEACLLDPDPGVCAAACQALGRMGDSAAVPALFELLGDDRPQVSQAAVNAIISLGSGRTEALTLAAVRSSSPIERRGAIRIISTLGYERGLTDLIAAIDDPDERLRDIALPGLALLESPEAMDALLSAAVHSSKRTRASAMRGLGNARVDPRVDKALRSALEDLDPWVRYHACHALGHRKDLQATDALVKRLEDEAGQVRIAALEALAHLPGDVPRQVVQAAATSDDADMRRAAVVGLGLLGGPEVLPTLLDATRSSDPSTRLVALSALINFKQPAALQALVTAAMDHDEGVRTAAIGVLGTMPGEPAARALIDLCGSRISRILALTALSNPLQGRVPAMLDALERSDDVTAGTLVALLARIQRADAIEGLINGLSSKNVAARRAVASVLGAVTSPRARPALAIAATTDVDIDVRRLAAAALES
jgi:HEAT repeat protein